MKIFALALLLVCSWTAAVPAQEKISLMPDADTGNPWILGIGAQFPGATGSLHLDAVVLWNGTESLRLTGDFTDGGKYVEAYTSIAGIDPREISFWVRDWKSDNMAVKLTDSTGRCFQFKLRTRVAIDWQQVVLPLEEFFANNGAPNILELEAWGGTAEAKWQGPAKRLSISLANDGPTKTQTIYLNGVTAELRAGASIPTTKEERIRSVTVRTENGSYYFKPGEEHRITLGLASSKPLKPGQEEIELFVRDYAGAPIGGPIREKLRPAERDLKFCRYQAAIDLSPLPLEPGVYYEAVARARQLTGEIVTGTTPFTVLPEPAAKALTWQTSTLSGTTAVFPHPILPQRAIAATLEGPAITEDAGRSWTLLPGAAPAKIGSVSRVAFHPADCGTFFIGSEKGLWMTANNGKTLRMIGNSENGMAANNVTDLIVYPGDGSFQTLLAVHGEAGRGISRSNDLGKTWNVSNENLLFRRVLGRERRAKEIYLFGSTPEDPDILNLYCSSTPGEFAVELMRDALLTDMTFAIDRESVLYVATSDKGLWVVDRTHELKPAGSLDVEWASVAAAWTENPDLPGIYLYDPSQRGLVFTSDDLATTMHIPGPAISSFVKEGAAVSPNANGSVFYAVINDTLSVGRPPEGTPAVTITPPVFKPARGDDKPLADIAKAFREFAGAKESAAKAAQTVLQKRPAEFYDQFATTVLAQFSGERPRNVFADLSRFGSKTNASLFDDGNHGDGSAGDGIYGVTFANFPLLKNQKKEDWRPNRPGRSAFGVTALYANGEKQQSACVMAVYPTVQSFDFWRDNEKITFVPEGDVAAEWLNNPPELHQGSMAIRIASGSGPWSIHLKAPYGRNNITGQQALTFWIRAEGIAPDEVSLQLRDGPELSEPVTTDRVDIVAGGIAKAAIGPEYQCIAIPVGLILEGPNGQLDPSRLREVIISGPDGAPATFWIDGLRFCATLVELEQP